MIFWRKVSGRSDFCYMCKRPLYFGNLRKLDGVTMAMCSGLTDLILADVHVAVTGLTCPGGSETVEKPVGTIFICGFYQGNKLFSERLHFKGSELEIISQTVSHTAQLLMKWLDADRK